MIRAMGGVTGSRLAWQRLHGRPVAEWPVEAQVVAALLLATGLSTVAGLVLLRLEQEALRAQQERQQKLQQDYRQRLSEVARLPALRAQAQEMARQQVSHAGLAPAAAREAELLSTLHRTAAAHGLQVGRLQPGKEKLLDGHARRSLQMRAEGRYDSVADMLRALQGLSWSVVPERWSLAPDRSRAGRASGALVWQGKLAVYRFTQAGEGPVRKKRKAGEKTS